MNENTLRNNETHDCACERENEKLKVAFLQSKC